MSRKEKAKEFADKELCFTITGRSVSVTDTMKNYAMEKISKIERFTDRIVDVFVTMDIQKLDNRVDILMTVGDIVIKSHAATTDMYASIDMAVHKIESQVRRYKTRLEDHHARGLPSLDLLVNVLEPHRQDELHEVNDDIDEENHKVMEAALLPHKIVSQEKYPLKLLSRDEAVMKMELSQDPFLVFLDEENRKINVIYRREDDENYGIIETEASIVS